MAQAVFKDKQLECQFDELGYIIIDLLSPEDVGLQLSYFRTLSEEDRAVFTTFASQNQDAKRFVDHCIKASLAGHFQTLFEDYEPFWGNYFVKHAGASAMPLHADLQYVDEPEYRSFNIWCPLTDTNYENGALGIVPRSHFVVMGPRGTNVTNGYRKHAAAIRDSCGKVLMLRAGQAVIYDHRLLHWSVANATTEPRIALTMVGTPKNVQKLHYYADSEDSVRVERFHINSSDDLILAGFQQRPNHLEVIEITEGCRFNPLTPQDIPFH